MIPLGPLERLGSSVAIRHEDILTADYSDATVVTLFLLPKSNASLRPRLEKLARGTRIVRSLASLIC